MNYTGNGNMFQSRDKMSIVGYVRGVTYGDGLDIWLRMNSYKLFILTVNLMINLKNHVKLQSLFFLTVHF